MKNGMEQGEHRNQGNAGVSGNRPRKKMLVSWTRVMTLEKEPRPGGWIKQDLQKSMESGVTQKTKGNSWVWDFNLSVNGNVNNGRGGKLYNCKSLQPAWLAGFVSWVGD